MLQVVDTFPREGVIAVETEADHAAIEALITRVFGPGRYVKTAERLRENNAPLKNLSYVARYDGAIIGSVRLWPVKVYGADQTTDIAFLGPIAVDPVHQGLGLGRTLIEAAVDAAFAAGVRAVLLVGTPSYFQKFGFEVAIDLTLPGPVDYKRLLIRYNKAVAGEALTGAVAR